jgi:hypothetical protein
LDAAALYGDIAMRPVYVAFDGDDDKWAYGFMKGWKTNEKVDFEIEDARGLYNMTGAALVPLPC